MQRWLFLTILVCTCVSSVKASDIQTAKSELYAFQNIIALQDEFISGGSGSGVLGSLGWVSGGGTASITTSLPPNIGILQRATGTTPGTIARMQLNTSSFLLSTSYNYDQIWIARAVSIDSDIAIRIGTSADWTVDPPSHGVYLEKLYADTNWFCVSRRNGSTETRVDTGVAVSTNFFKFRTIFTTGVGSLLYINDVLVCTITTNLPNQLITPGSQVINQTTDSKAIWHDYFQINVTGPIR